MLLKTFNRAIDSARYVCVDVTSDMGLVMDKNIAVLRLNRRNIGVYF